MWLIFLNFSIVVACVSTNLTEQHFDKVASAFDSLLNSMTSDDLDLDAFLGLAISQNQLKLAFRHSSEKLVPTFGKLYLKCVFLIQETMNSNLAIQNPNFRIILDFFTRRMIQSAKFPNDTEFSKKPASKNITELIDYFEQSGGFPTGEESNQCLFYVFTEFNQRKGCKIPVNCKKILLSRLEDSHGYSLTHRALFATLLNSIGCHFNLDLRIWKLCYQIYDEAQLIITNDRDFMFRDLFLEQVLVCGLNKFSPFLNWKWINLILSWQNKQGCFGIPELDQQVELPRVKRSDHNFNGNCHTHTTGVAAAFLSTVLNNYFTENKP